MYQTGVGKAGESQKEPVQKTEETKQRGKKRENQLADTRSCNLPANISEKFPTENNIMNQQQQLVCEYQVPRSSKQSPRGLSTDLACN